MNIRKKSFTITACPASYGAKKMVVFTKKWLLQCLSYKSKCVQNSVSIGNRTEFCWVNVLSHSRFFFEKIFTMEASVNPQNFPFKQKWGFNSYFRIKITGSISKSKKYKSKKKLCKRAVTRKCLTYYRKTSQPRLSMKKLLCNCISHIKLLIG